MAWRPTTVKSRSSRSFIGESEVSTNRCLGSIGERQPELTLLSNLDRAVRVADTRILTRSVVRILTPCLDPRRVITVEDWADIRRLHRAEGMPIKAIARHVGVARNTVRAAFAADEPAAVSAGGQGFDRRCDRASGAGVVAGVPDDADDGDRRANRLAAFDHGPQGPDAP